MLTTTQQSIFETHSRIEQTGQSRQTSLQDKVQHHLKLFSKVLKRHSATKQIKCDLKTHYHINYNDIKLQKHNLKLFL